MINSHCCEDTFETEELKNFDIIIAYKSHKFFNHTPFLQILQEGIYHWVALFTCSCKPCMVILTDSYIRGKINHKIKEQICSNVCDENSSLEIQVVSVLQQGEMSLDYGLFAPALIQYIMESTDFLSKFSLNQQKCGILCCRL